jgi:hypothetical protein
MENQSNQSFLKHVYITDSNNLFAVHGVPDMLGKENVSQKQENTEL